MVEKNDKEKQQKALEEITMILDREGLQLQVQQQIILAPKE